MGKIEIPTAQKISHARLKVKLLKTGEEDEAFQKDERKNP